MRLYSRPDCPAQRKRNRNQVTDKKICHWSFFGVVSGQDKNSVQYGTFTFVANYSDFTTYSLYNRIYNNERGKKKSYRVVWGRGRPAVPLLMPHRDICQVWNVPFHLRFKQTKRSDNRYKNTTLTNTFKFIKKMLAKTFLSTLLEHKVHVLLSLRYKWLGWEGEKESSGKKSSVFSKFHRCLS